MKKLFTVTTIVVFAVLLATMLMACTPSADSIKKKYEDKGYDVELATDEKLESMGEMYGYGELEYMIYADNEDGDYVSIVCFKKSDDAKKAYDKAKEEIDKMKEELGEEFDEEFGIEVKKSGNVIVSGTKAAVAIF